MKHRRHRAKPPGGVVALVVVLLASAVTLATVALVMLTGTHADIEGTKTTSSSSSSSSSGGHGSVAKTPSPTPTPTPTRVHTPTPTRTPRPTPTPTPSRPRASDPGTASDRPAPDGTVDEQMRGALQKAHDAWKDAGLDDEDFCATFVDAFRGMPGDGPGDTPPLSIASCEKEFPPN